MFEEHLKTATVLKGTSEIVQNELLDCMLSVIRERIMEEVCDTILLHAKERFSFTDHLVSATLLQGEMFEQYRHTFPAEALNMTFMVTLRYHQYNCPPPEIFSRSCHWAWMQLLSHGNQFHEAIYSLRS
ncbi:hypothetical protein AOLI_G00204270 [Acnodon oligacanthus]